MVISWFLKSTCIQTRKTVFFGNRWDSLSLCPSLNGVTHSPSLQRINSALFFHTDLYTPPFFYFKLRPQMPTGSYRSSPKARKWPQRQAKPRAERKTSGLLDKPLYQKINNNLKVPLGSCFVIGVLPCLSWLLYCTRRAKHMVGSAHWTGWSENTLINNKNEANKLFCSGIKSGFKVKPPPGHTRLHVFHLQLWESRTLGQVGLFDKKKKKITERPRNGAKCE